MIKLEIQRDAPLDRAFDAEVLLEHDQMKVRRIELAVGARIPPCQMQEDVLFVVLGGRVKIRADEDKTVVVSPGVVFIPGGATTRSMEAHEPSLVLAVLCRRAVGPNGNEGVSQP